MPSQATGSSFYALNGVLGNREGQEFYVETAQDEKFGGKSFRAVP